MSKLFDTLTKSEKSAPCLFYPMMKQMGYSMDDILHDAKKHSKLLQEIPKTYPVSAVIRMTELWCEAASFGTQCYFSEGEFPHLGRAICPDTTSIREMKRPKAVNSTTKPLIDAVEYAAPKMKVPLLIGITGPYTLASVLNGSENFMMGCMMDPQGSHSFLEFITEFILEYATVYKKAGASGLVIAEPSSCMLTPKMMEQFSNAYLEKVITPLKDENFSILYHNCGDVNPHLEVIAKINADGYHLGNNVDLSKALSIVPENKLVMGNVDPRLFLKRDKEPIINAVKTLKKENSNQKNYILSTGCDLSPSSDLNMIDSYFEACK